jgi:hypothetical protein
MIRIVLLSITLFLSISLSAQEGCAFILEEAQEMFDAGLIETIPDRLAGCMEDGFTKDEKLEAYKLIIQSYLFDDDMEQAESVMLEFLNEFPAYEPVATDPREFVVLKELFDTRPVLMVGGSMGTNLTFPIVTDRVGIYNFNEYRGRYTPGGAGIQGAVRIERRIVPRINFFTELMYSNSRFDFYFDNDNEPQPFTGEITDFSKIEYYETQNLVCLPAGATVFLNDGDLRPYITVGFMPVFNVLVTADGLREYENTGDINPPKPVIVQRVNVGSTRRTFNVSAFAGAGAKYKVGPGELFLDARFNVNLLNQVKPGSERVVQDLAFEIFYVSDNLLLNGLAVSAGYLLPIYNPKKKAF